MKTREVREQFLKHLATALKDSFSYQGGPLERFMWLVSYEPEVGYSTLFETQLTLCLSHQDAFHQVLNRRISQLRISLHYASHTTGIGVKKLSRWAQNGHIHYYPGTTHTLDNDILCKVNLIEWLLKQGGMTLNSAVKCAGNSLQNWNEIKQNTYYIILRFLNINDHDYLNIIHRIIEILNEAPELRLTTVEVPPAPDFCIFNLIGSHSCNILLPDWKSIRGDTYDNIDSFSTACQSAIENSLTSTPHQDSYNFFSLGKTESDSEVQLCNELLWWNTFHFLEGNPFNPIFRNIFLRKLKLSIKYASTLGVTERKLREWVEQEYGYIKNYGEKDGTIVLNQPALYWALFMNFVIENERISSPQKASRFVENILSLYSMYVQQKKELIISTIGSTQGGAAQLIAGLVSAFEDSSNLTILNIEVPSVPEFCVFNIIAPSSIETAKQYEKDGIESINFLKRSYKY